MILCEYLDQVGIAGCLGGIIIYIPAIGDCPLIVGRARQLRDDDINSGIAQAQRLRRTLNAIADDGNLLALKHTQVCIGVIVDGNSHTKLLLQH